MLINQIKQVQFNPDDIPSLVVNGEFLYSNKAMSHVVIPVADGLPVTLNYVAGRLVSIDMHGTEEKSATLHAKTCERIGNLSCYLDRKVFNTMAIHGVIGFDPIYSKEEVLKVLPRALKDNNLDTLKFALGSMPNLSFNYLYVTGYAPNDQPIYAHWAMAGMMKRTFRINIKRWHPLSVTEDKYLKQHNHSQQYDIRRNLTCERLLAKQAKVNADFKKLASDLIEAPKYNHTAWSGFLITTNNYHRFIEKAFDERTGHDTAILFKI